MTDLILRIFVRDHKNTEDPAVRDKCGRVAGAVGIVTNFLLFLMKIIVGTVFHSVSGQTAGCPRARTELSDRRRNSGAA